MARLTPGLRRLSAGAQVLLIDGAMWGRRLYSHLTIQKALPELASWPVGRIVFTQIGRSAPPTRRSTAGSASAACGRALGTTV